jgi:adenosylcobinamide amidohydrolase
MLLGKFYDGLELHREDRIIFARFLIPHRVISTCRAGGGIQDGLEYVYNHQACEPAGHAHGPNPKAALDPAGYRRDVCARHGLPPEGCAALGTAANMNLAHVEEASFRDLSVVAVATGGVETNAGRAGDPASGYEGPNGYESLSRNSSESGEPRPGTINTLLFIGKPLTPGALVRTIMTATEAKCAALQELAVNSRYSDGPATGTGTDQIAVACALIDGDRPLTSAGKHVKLGELIGCTVKAAIKGTLARQNGMSAASQCSVRVHLERFGLDAESLTQRVTARLDEPMAELWRCNFRGLDHDPLTVAAAAALAHLKDKFSWGFFPSLSYSEIMAAQAAQLAAAVSGKFGCLDAYRRMLAPQAGESDNVAFLALVTHALALGFRDKWN